MTEQASVSRQFAGERLAGSLIERVAWAWTDLVRVRGLPIEVLAVLVFGLLYGGSAAIALFLGELEAFVRDVRWPASFLIVAASAYYLLKLPQAIDRLWASLRPWLANSDQEIDVLIASTRPTLARFFLPSALIWASFIAYWAATNSWGESFQGEYTAPLLHVYYGPFLAYFTGAAVAFNSVGLWVLLGRLARTIDFKPALILRGGKRALRPFNQLLLGNLIFFLTVVIATAIGTMPVSGQGLRAMDFALWGVVAAFTVALALAQLSMNGALEREKGRELQRLRDEMEAACVIEDDASPAEILRCMHRMQVLNLDLQRVEAFSPTLVDTRFMVQISLSVTAILIANVVLRTVLEGLI